MALLELIGRLGLNTQPFESGLKRAKDRSDSTARDISRAFTRVGLGLLGISSVGSAFQQVIRQTVQWSKNIEETKKEFERLGLTIDEKALRSIQQTGIELERLKVQFTSGLIPVLGKLGTILNDITDQMALAMSGALMLFDEEKGMSATFNVVRKAMERNAALNRPLEQPSKALDTVKKATEPVFRRPQETNAPPIDFGSLARVGTFGMVAGNAPAQRHVELIVQYTQATAKATEITAEQLREFRREQQFMTNRDEFYGGFKQL